MVFKQLTMMILMVLSSDAAAWWLLKAQGLATKWIAPSAYTIATIGALIIAVVTASFMTRWKQLVQPTERVVTAPDNTAVPISKIATTEIVSFLFFITVSITRNGYFINL